MLERSQDCITFTPFVDVPAATTSYTDSSSIYPFYRIYAVNGPDRSAYSNVANSTEISASGTGIEGYRFVAHYGANDGGDVCPPYSVGNCDAGTWLKIPDVYFSSSLNQVTVTYASPQYPGNYIDFRLGSPTGPIIGRIVTQLTATWNTTVTDTAQLTSNYPLTSGVYDLYVTFDSGGTDWSGLCNFFTFQFSDSNGLAAPTGLSVAAGSAGVTVTWSGDPGNAQGYKVERSTDDQTFVEVGAAGANATSYLDTTAAPSTIYYYRVRAYNDVTTSTYTATVSNPQADPNSVTVYANSSNIPIDVLANDQYVPDLTVSEALTVVSLTQPAMGRRGLCMARSSIRPAPGTSAATRSATPSATARAARPQRRSMSPCRTRRASG